MVKHKNHRGLKEMGKRPAAPARVFARRKLLLGTQLLTVLLAAGMPGAYGATAAPVVQASAGSSIAESVIYSFKGVSPSGGPADGVQPQAPLIQASDGNFYGTTQGGGGLNSGTVFRLTPSGTETVLHTFANFADGGDPQGALLQASDGNLYGTTLNTIYEITLAGDYKVLYAAGSYGSLIQGSDGNLYGTGAAGTVFKMTLAGEYTVLHTFSSPGDGTSPRAGLVQGPDGNFYGTTQQGGSSYYGTVFKITPAGEETVLHSFVGSMGSVDGDGDGPLAALTLGSDGNFYGTTEKGGANNYGTVFKISPRGEETVFHSFAYSDGVSPTSALLLASDGNFYGTAGSGSKGLVFEMTPAGVETVLYAFTGSPDGADPAAGLIQASDGNLYGTTISGGSVNSSFGTVYKLTFGGTPAPSFSPAAGTYTSAQSITISDAVAGATIYYTTDGSTPTTSSSVYTHPITVSSTETVKAMAVAAGDTNSGVASAAYTINAPSGGSGGGGNGGSGGGGGAMGWSLIGGLGLAFVLRRRAGRINTRC